ncbi:histone methyltransferase SET2 KNAG_0C02410 [Huiozyma naganishii CBS 8797]|uniref:Histone-lysine N-methyltransferase, H3 lysine-36 specific n=1 Tax=Huiozyma naganishii (strain ATCC MYA-139 / BCRC 22969 / CBS 8797 / KCTC 17520 / NBRC 10181 / NCYC 3082 / Yp74L-3) TaxID=1071383 RepID=J7RWH2_HUIN7|nr:hypothetical protein KNAG_0C02410 [Kazachstania naganishii CBS 8797]CCK69352.1 hypothetical protein KNAG_0C02410 [Kazachstania naganishii CBS 8797]
MSAKSETPPRIPQLFPNEESKTDEALSTFTPLESCIYTSKYLGNSNNEFMECDCFETFETDEKTGERFNASCGEDSDCINRLTLIECVDGLCESTCGKNCQNQRFQRKQYADVMVFQTKMKGYGVLAKEDIDQHQFIYEYMGEVIDEEEFRDRMATYDEKKFKHFYFMMLQNGQFIDATMKGCLARFCNHSCSPNAYVNKWVVNGKLKMGIFASRKILKDEEITFDYNVDRYGATAQKCYCGEPNCIGFLGGKTQTDAASLLPQSYADALGVSVSMEKKWIKAKKASGETITKSDDENINVEFVESLEITAVEDESDVTKIMSVLLQLDNKLIALKLFQRLFSIESESLLYKVIKLHGYKCFANLLELFGEDEDVIKDILVFLDKLPKTTKNGVVASHINEKVRAVMELFPMLESEGSSLLSKWDSYETYTRITKRELNQTSTSIKSIDLRRLRLPPGWEMIQENGRPMYYNAQEHRKLAEPPKITNTQTRYDTSNGSRYQNYSPSNGRGPMSDHRGSEMYRNKRPLTPDVDYESKAPKLNQDEELERKKEEERKRLKAKYEEESAKRDELTKIIADANRQKEIEREEQLKLEREKEERKLKRKTMSHSAHIERKWNNFFALFVPNLVRKYTTDVALNHDYIKQCSRDITKILTNKELRKDPKTLPPSEPDRDKRAKVKKFVNLYMEKLVNKYKQKKEKKNIMPPSSS